MDLMFRVGTGEFSEEKFAFLEKFIQNEIPKSFKSFITFYKGASMNWDYIDDFELRNGYDPRGIFSNKKTEAILASFLSSFLFFDLENRKDDIVENLLPSTLISFATDGAGRYFCFDYALEKNGKVPVVIVMPDADAEERGRYIADDFEQFLEMLGNPEMEAPYYTIEYPYIEDN